MNFNQLILGGRLTRDCETTFTQGGTAVVKFGLAVNHKYKRGTGDEVEEVLFVDVAMFGKRGEAFARFHRKGAEAFVVGRLKLDQWDDKKTGERRSKLNVIADEWQFVGGKRDGSDGYEQAPASHAAPMQTVSGEAADDTPF